MANHTQQPWFQGDPNAGMKSRVEAIQKMRDPGTFADEILRGAKWLLVLSLLFTGALCFFSYMFFLERFLNPIAAIAAAVAVTILIEYGKQRIGMAAIRMPFMQGWRFIFSTQENTIMFAGAGLFALVIFSISVYNSTNGAAKYAEQTSRAKTETNWRPQTSNLDAEIASVQERINNAPKARWKGKEYYQDAKAVREAEKNLGSLQRQREEAIKQQRADFERTRTHNDDANAHSATIALRVGGWLELVQVILMLLRGACERVLDRRAGRPEQQRQNTNQQQQQNQIGFKPVSAEYDAPPPPPNKNNPIGFKQYDQPQATAATQPPSVSQPPHPVTQTKGLLVGKDADDAIRMHLIKVKREPSNFNNRHANNDTVAGRMIKALEDMKNTLHGVESCSNTVYVEVREYLDRVAIPALINNGHFYDTNELYTMLYKRAGGTETNA